ncbi:MAG TPA: DNA-directed RNA polymerase subunit alpha [Gemmatimonadota bacterium]|nr:DNA-directed RNA polymerase subunit alpha [Gemmatimonadota bacterium]
MALENFILPKRVEKNPDSLSDTHGEFHVQPLERGFGLTLGNALRRVLLSSLEGAAVWGVRIDNVLHEFSTIPGGVEDTAEVIMSLKNLVLTLPDGVEETTLRLSRKERGDITAADFEDNAQVTILNPDLHLLSMDENKKFAMEVYVKRGRGYVPSDQHDQDRRKEIGFIAVDSIFSPVTRANFRVENTRVGRRTDYDKLTIDVETSGAIDPEHAIAQAAEILRTHFEYFLSFEMPGEELEGELEAKHNRFKELFARPVDELELSVRSGNCLKASNIRTLGDLVQKSESEMLQFRNFGKKSLNEISDILQRHGLTFGMSVRRNPASGDYEVQDREELRRLPDVQLGDEEEELEGEFQDGGEEE